MNKDNSYLTKEYIDQLLEDPAFGDINSKCPSKYILRSAASWDTLSDLYTYEEED